MKNQLGLDKEYDDTILVLQGGGSLGAYQAGAFESLSRAGIEFDWIVGVSIGAINASIIAGNPPESRVAKLRSFWESVTADYPPAAFAFSGASGQNLYASLSALRCFTLGVPGFFLPRVDFSFDELVGVGDTSFYDTSPLRKLLEQHVDFDMINSGSVRLSLRSVNVKTGQVVCFDNRETRIGPENIMASGALPPGFPPIQIGSDYYWDGGIISNTPLSFVLDAATSGKSLIFEVDLFNRKGNEPKTINDVLGPVEIHREFMTAAAMWIMAAKL
ncbi:patatin-like phospholipase family protein [Methylocystis sp.]|uniref:patatin-like phospholipase family protein n=1 Tax=Methylocystis sp. TaxID=1911079 RepID=UPI003D0A8949